MLRRLILLLFSIAPALTAAGNNIPPELIHWEFTSTDSSKSFKISENYPLWRQLPKDVPCCSGIYHLTFSTSEFRVLAQNIPGEKIYILFPLTLGLKKMWVNGRPELETKSDYSSAGPIISVSKREIESESLKVSYSAEIPKGFASGAWMQNFFVGTEDEVFEKRENLKIYQRYLSLGLAIFLGILALVILSSGILKERGSRIYSYFFQGLVAWSLFYISLSGTFRAAYPSLGIFLHLPLRVIAGLTFVRLLLFISEAPPKFIFRASTVGMFFVMASVVFGVWSPEVQAISYFLIGLLFNGAALYFLLVFARLRKFDLFRTLLAIATFIMFIGSNFDLIKVMGYFFFDYRSPLPFFSRLTDPPLILTSLIYLVDEASRRYRSELKSEIIESVREQVLHDLRSPISVLKVASSQKNFLGSEEKDLIRSACDRILKICDSLREDHLVASSDIEAVNVVQTINLRILKNLPQNQARFITFSCEEEGELIVKANSALFERIILNLLNNAFEASGDSPNIGIRVARDDKKVNITISDSGHGIPESARDSVFRKYYTSGKPSGLGLGLFHARKNILAWGGDIDLASSDKGTQITLSLKAAN